MKASSECEEGKEMSALTEADENFMSVKMNSCNEDSYGLCFSALASSPPTSSRLSSHNNILFAFEGETEYSGQSLCSFMHNQHEIKYFAFPHTSLLIILLI